jgi:hypothetical protein
VLTGLAADRYQLAIAGNELVALERDHSHLILDPYEDRVTVHQMNELIALVNAAMPTTVDEWIRLAEVGCSLAAYQSAPLRRDRFEAIRYANGMAADGGLRDRLLSDAAALIGSPAPRALIRAQ